MPILDLDKFFNVLYMDFHIAMLQRFHAYPSFNQFVLPLQGHEQNLFLYREEEKIHIQHAQAF